MRSFHKPVLIAALMLALLAALPTAGTMAAEPTPTPTPLPGGPMVLLAAGDTPVNIRSGPGAQYAVIGALGPGVPAPIVGQDVSRKWWLIRLSYDGWVNMKVSPVAGDVSGVPVVTSTIAARNMTLAPKVIVVVVTATPAAEPQAAQPPARTCCKICSKGKACGDSCISRDKTCHKGVGCACDG
jgi:SH3-like domain-containing protein